MKRDSERNESTITKAGDSGSMPVFTVISKLDLVAMYLDGFRPRKVSR